MHVLVLIEFNHKHPIEVYYLNEKGGIDRTTVNPLFFHGLINESGTNLNIIGFDCDENEQTYFIDKIGKLVEPETRDEISFLDWFHKFDVINSDQINAHIANVQREFAEKQSSVQVSKPLRSQSRKWFGFG